MKNGLLFIILLFLSLVTRAQFVNFGQDRACLRWKQIKTEDFQIIYPDFFEDNAQKIANLYARLYQHANTLEIKPKKISVIIHADGRSCQWERSLSSPQKRTLHHASPGPNRQLAGTSLRT